MGGESKKTQGGENTSLSAAARQRVNWGKMQETTRPTRADRERLQVSDERQAGPQRPSRKPVGKGGQSQ